MTKIKRLVIFGIITVFVIGLGVAIFTIFFDQAILVRKGTVYRVDESIDKVVAITFDDGPSPVWTPQILDKLKEVNIKATFFMLGKHVAKYPQIARRVAEEGHEIENHSYSHRVILYYKDEELIKEIKDTENIIKKVTGQTTKYFRPPKAWLTSKEKKKIRDIGYEVVLWSLNSKDWVTFDDKYIKRYISKHVRPGDIILFHDSGGAFSIEGGDRHETVLAVKRIAEKLKNNGYKFVTVDELLTKYRKQ